LSEKVLFKTSDVMSFKSTPCFDKACKDASRINFGDQDFIGANSTIVSIRSHSLTLIGSNWN
jgi:hypothetical protein